MGVDIQETIRTIVKEAIAPQVLPATRSLHLYYVRALVQREIADSERYVPRTPTFMYILDAGLPSLAGISIEFAISGLGDPSFPNLNRFELFSVHSYRDDDILRASTAGAIQIEVLPGTSEAEVVTGLQTFASGIERHGDGNFYAAQVTPFFEKRIGEKIKEKLPFVVNVTGAFRLRSDYPWFVSQVL
jgi:hypothetical protein